MLSLGTPLTNSADWMTSEIHHAGVFFAGCLPELVPKSTGNPWIILNVGHAKKKKKTWFPINVRFNQWFHVQNKGFLLLTLAIHGNAVARHAPSHSRVARGRRLAGGPWHPSAEAAGECQPFLLKRWWWWWWWWGWWWWWWWWWHIFVANSH